MSAGLEASTETPGNTAPVVSLTTPAKPLCAEAIAGIRNRNDKSTPAAATRC